MQTEYTSDADCLGKTQPLCDGPTTCLAGTYHADKDQHCLEAMEAVTCADLEANSGPLLPTVCLEVCTTG